MITLNIMSYRYGHLAAQAIESALLQSKPFDRIRFFDDGVGDCGHLQDIYPEVEYILREKNLGVINNFNDALSTTETDRVVFLGADNWLAPNFNEVLSKHAEDIVWSYATKVSDTYTLWDIKQPHGSAMYRTELAKACFGYEESNSGTGHTEEDSMLFNKMMKAGATTAYEPYPLFYYRWRHRRNFNQ